MFITMMMNLMNQSVNHFYHSAGVIAAFLIFGTVCVVFIDELTGIFTQTSNTIDVPKLVGMDLNEANDTYRIISYKCY